MNYTKNDNTAYKKRALTWEFLTSRIWDLEVRVVKMDNMLAELLEGPLKVELSKRRAKLATMLDDVFADRELLKSEYWGFYDNAA